MMGKIITTQYVENFLENFDYKLKDVYKNSKIKMEMICPKGHSFKMEWNSFHTGNRCPICNKIPKDTYDTVKCFVEKEGYDLLSKKYQGGRGKSQILVKCEKNHIYNVDFYNFRAGKRCPYCAGNKKLTYEYVKSFIEEQNYKLHSNNYIKNSEFLKVECNKGHIYDVRYSNFQKGHRCPKCSHLTSRPEEEIFNFVKFLYSGNIIHKDRKQIYNHKTKRYLELDIWLPDESKAIEVNSIYYHRNRKLQDRIKKKQCIEKGINLLCINEERWRKNKNLVMMKLQNFMEA